MTVEEFSTYVIPETSQIVFFVDEGYIIKAANISTTACEAVNTFDALSQITSITVTINNSLVTLSVLSYTVESSYYAFVLEPLVIPGFSGDVSSLDSADCNLITFLPSANDASFENSDYNALINNALDIRLNSFAYDVDRQKSLTQPTNLTNIIADTALYAPVPDSNYSSIGLLNSRYEGSETSVEDYGIESSINLTLFDAASYPINTTDINICSQSLQERNIIEFGFDSSGNPKVSPDTLPTASYNFGLDGYVFGDMATPATLTSNETTFTARINKKVVPFIKPGVFLQLTDTSNYIYVQVESITFNSTYSISQDVYDFVVKKHILTQSANLTGNGSSSYNINVRVGFSDTVYFFEGNKIIPHSNKKLYLGLTGQVIRTGNNGRVIDISTTCSI